jgi:tetratricopeptide (TPR) repeat protein
MGTGLTEGLLGDVFVRLGKLTEARALLLDAVEIERRALGGAHRNLGMTLSSLANLYVKSSEFDKADASFRESIDMFEQTGSMADPIYAGTLQRYVRLLRKSNRKTEASHVESRANTVLAFQKSHRP